MLQNKTLLPQNTLFKIFRQELLERLKRALLELQSGPASCNYDAVHQEMDSLVGAARTMGQDWLEHDSRTLAGYARFLRNRKVYTANDPCHLMLVNVIIEMKKESVQLTTETLQTGKRPTSNMPELLQGLERKMELGLTPDYTINQEPDVTLHDKKKANMKKPIILVVDDSATSRLLFKAHLPQPEKYQLYEAEDMPSAVQQWGLVWWT